MAIRPHRMVYRTNAEILWIWDDVRKQWVQPAIKAVSGGGRGLKERYGGTYGVHHERQETGRISNLGGNVPWEVKGQRASPTDFGSIPNGIFEVGVPHHSAHLGQCAALNPVQGSLMGRGGFYIHGEGKIGSEGCIIPINNKIDDVLIQIRRLQIKGPLYLLVEGSITFDLPERLSHYV